MSLHQSLLAQLSALATHFEECQAARIRLNRAVSGTLTSLSLSGQPQPVVEAALAPLSGPVDASGEPELDLTAIKARQKARSKIEHLHGSLCLSAVEGQEASNDCAELVAEIERLRAAAVPSSPAQAQALVVLCHPAPYWPRRNDRGIGGKGPLCPNHGTDEGV
jgi:hypothetical protein